MVEAGYGSDRSCQWEAMVGQVMMVTAHGSGK